MRADPPAEVRPGVARARRPDPSPAGFVGMALLACAFFLCAASAMVGAGWTTPVMLGIWCVGLVAAVRWFTPAPARVVLVAVAVLVAWVLVVPGWALLR